MTPPSGHDTERAMELVIVAVVAVALVALWASARAAVTVCVLDITAGDVVVRSGGLAPRVLADIGDIAARPKIERATLRIVREGGRAALEVRGAVPPAQLQQLRNVVGSVPLAKLRNARRRR
jgi:Protein of unknown function (DUF3634)